MRIIDKIENKLGRFAINNLMKYIAALTGAVYIINMFDLKHVVLPKLVLVPRLVLNGEVWRVATFIFIPASTSIFALFVLYFYYMMGNALENEWGAFRFNVYYLIGVLSAIAASFITGVTANSLYLNLSLLLAFAYLYPNFQILLFFLIPVKIKYLAIIEVIFYCGSIITGNAGTRIYIIASLVNFIIFFAPDIIRRLKTGRRSYINKRDFKEKLKVIDFDAPVHRCHVCGITEKDNPDMEFRYCSKCDGDYEYCMEHLKNHEHIKHIQ